jgi:hypothetical protein
MTQTLNSLRTSLSRGEGRLSKEASKQAGRQDTESMHCGLWDILSLRRSRRLPKP